MPGRWRKPGAPFRTLWRIHLVCKLSEVRLRKARDRRRKMHERRERDRGRKIAEKRGRDRGQKTKARQGLLRLRQLSEVRRRLLGQARRHSLPAVQSAVPAAKDNQERRHHPLLRQRRLRLQSTGRYAGG